ncbi:MATE family efflux transporter [Plantactinospora endophytica]|uniref:O-antigen/teichoic acid export membrane protein n=1 Tax=Plantactinospora endophytica TaxID=673535 RepID=A0ABQ4EAJ7_9ACTN|nr:hypothetical protein [Plantactinospora endophytica]GIG91685.1 hypothetical protein Pen02_66210 [Plantactinospora endophytica]
MTAGSGWRATLRTLRRQVLSGGRAPVAVAVTATSSLGNLLLSVTVAHGGSLSELGRYALAFSLYVLVSGLARAMVTESVLAETDRRDPTPFRRSARRVCLLGAGAGALVGTVGLLAGNHYLTVVGPALPGLVLYDYLKAYGLGVADPRRILRYELVWTVASAVAAGLGLAGRISALTVFVVWAGAGAAVGWVGAARRRCALLPGWPVGRTETRNALAFGLHFLVGSGTAQLATAALATVAGTAVVGALGGAKTALGPITLLLGATSALLIPYLARSRDAGPRVRLRSAARITGAIGLLVGPLALLLPALPDPVGRALLGANWAHARPLLPALAVESVFMVAAMVAFAGHRIERAGARTLLLGAVLGPVRVGAIVGAGHLFGAAGAAWAMAGVACCAATGWWWSYRSLLRTRDRAEPVLEPV